jgi:mRNA interferase MazF
VVIAQGEIWWADLGEPLGSEPGFRRPVIVVQGDSFNRSRIATVVCVPLTSNLRWADAPGNVALGADITGLPKDSVASVSQLVTLDKTSLTERAGLVPDAKIELILAGIDLVLGRD